MHSRRALAAVLASSLALGCQSTPAPPPASAPAPSSSSVETKETFFARGRAEVDFNARIQPNKRKAKNVILFLGDGMGVTTITAARILDGQMKGMKFGEENDLSFEKFPHLAHSKTYQANQQTPDSAPTMTSIVTGSKANDGMLSVAPAVLDSNDFRGAMQPENRLTTILEQAEEQGMWTGVVTTARLTHATPAACYAHSPNRDWEHDGKLTPEAAAAGFPDIARQLLDFSVRPTRMNGKPSQGLEVAMGGGRARFLSEADKDPESGEKGLRKDKNLAAEWKARGGEYVEEQAGFDGIDPATTGPVLGLFQDDHMQYELERKKDVKGEPSLTEMTEKAIRILKRSPKGFFLMVEAGRIDHGHHAGRAKLALTDAVELSRAVQRAAELAGEDTLILVTADHSHTFTMGGYPTRGNPILGLVVENESSGLPASRPAKAKDGKPYTTLGYANGPGAVTGEREDLSTKDTTADDFKQQSLYVPEGGAETHGGEDVVIYARGPHAYLIEGTMEENAIYFVMARALGFKEPGKGSR